MLWQCRLYDDWDESFWDGGVDEYRGPLSDDDIVYINDNYQVNKGTYYNKNIIFPPEKVTEEWKEFVNQELKFSVPSWCGEKIVKVLSIEEQEERRERVRQKRAAKVAASPTLFHGWDLVPDILEDWQPQLQVNVSQNQNDFYLYDPNASDFGGGLNQCLLCVIRWISVWVIEQ